MILGEMSWHTVLDQAFLYESAVFAFPSTQHVYGPAHI